MKNSIIYAISIIIVLFIMIMTALCCTWSPLGLVDKFILCGAGMFAAWVYLKIAQQYSTKVEYCDDLLDDELIGKAIKLSSMNDIRQQMKKYGEDYSNPYI